MAKYYAPNFAGLLPLFDGKSAAGGKLYAYRAGSSIPAPLFDEDGTELGSWVSIDSNGCADFLLDSALSYKLVAKDALGAVVGEWDNVKATNAEGMENPMQNPGDLIVGGTGGTATALPVGADGEVLTSDGTTASWAAPAAQPGDHLVKASATDAAAGYLGAKLTAGSNVTLTPQTDGDGVQTLEISSSGGGGGSYITQFAPRLARGFCQYVFQMSLPSTWTKYAVSFFRSVPFCRKFSRIYIALTNIPPEITSANCALYYRDANGDYVTDNVQTALAIKSKLRTGANTNDPVYYIDLDSQMDTTDGSRNYRLAVQLVAATKPSSALAFWPDNAFLKSPITGSSAWDSGNGYFRLYANNDVGWSDIWLSMNDYWQRNDLTSTLTNIPSPSSAQWQIMPWMAVE